MRDTTGGDGEFGQIDRRSVVVNQGFAIALGTDHDNPVAAINAVRFAEGLA